MGSPRPGRELARLDGHNSVVWAVTALEWPGLDHPVIVTASMDETARVWDPRDPGRELARFDGHTDEVNGVAALEWPGLDHPVVVTTSDDRTARVWDPRDSGQELAHIPLFAQGSSALALNPTTLTIASSRGHLVVELRVGQSSHGQ